MVRFLLITLLIGRIAPVSAQEVINGKYTVFRLLSQQDTITFIVVGDRAELAKKKPVLLFRQGSLANPLFGRYARGISAIVFPFYTTPYEKDYHIVAIAKPGVALMADSAHMAQTVETRSSKYLSKKFLDNNYLDFYVNQTNQVIDYLLKQPFVDPAKLVICGGSEGYHVSIKTAYTNPHITHLIAFSGFPDGRWQGQIREVRERANRGEMTQQQGQEMIESMYAYWEKIVKDPMNTPESEGDPYRTTYSFSEGRDVEYLTRLTIPIYICYGTADPGSLLNDTLPIEFARRGKTNLTLKAYLDYDHVFYELRRDGQGKVIDKIYRGDEVAKAYMDWLKQH